MSVAAFRFNNDLRYRDASDPRNVQLTPEYVLGPVRESLGGWIDLDPCTEPDNPTGAYSFYTAEDDGLTKLWWSRSVYCNPPYGKAREPWVDRCIEAAQRGVLVILLIPAHPDTRTFQKAAESSDWVLFIKGRLKFGIPRSNGRQLASSHPSALIGWNCEAPRGLGIVMETKSAAE